MFKKIVLSSLFALLPFGAGAAELPAYPFIHVSATGTMAIMPDVGEIEFEITARDADAAVAVQTVAARVAEVRALMTEAGVADDSLEVRDMRKEIMKGDPAAVVYEIRCGVKVTVSDLSKWKAVVAPLLDKPNLDGFTTTFDSSQRLKVEAELMAQAIRLARAKADAIAAGFGRKVGAVSGVSNSELKNMTRAMNLAPFDYFQRGGARRDEGDRTELLMVNLMKLAQPVDVIFRIK
jgi:uncharacterized protein YggE